MASDDRHHSTVNAIARLAVFCCVACAPSRHANVRSDFGTASWACAPSGPETCSDARDNNCNGLVDEGCGIGSGLIQFMIAWREETDLDLEVTDPEGGQARVGAVSSAGLIKDRDCPGREERRCRGVNVENVVLAPNRDPKPGQYRVVIRLAPRQEMRDPVGVTLSGRLGARVLTESFVVSTEVPQRIFVWDM
jgi:hypothetical protein